MIRFALAHAGDVPRLRKLVERAYRGQSAKQGWTHEADLLDDERTSDEELADAVADDLGNARAYLGMLCVDPALQAEGLGRALIADAEDLAAELFGAKFMEMTVIDARTDLIAWYERRGYVRSGEMRPFPYGDAGRFGMVVLERRLR
jgi:GNAT superfamily N-acetyltransferase